jgi:hypothetical protein
MRKILRCTKSVIVAMTNICLLCGAGYMLDWISYLFKRSYSARGRFKRMVSKRLSHVYRQQVNAIKIPRKRGMKTGMTKIYQTWK